MNKILRTIFVIYLLHAAVSGEKLEELEGSSNEWLTIGYNFELEIATNAPRSPSDYSIDPEHSLNNEKGNSNNSYTIIAEEGAPESSPIFNYRCDYKYKKEIDSFIKYHDVPVHWHTANLRCLLEGARLLSPLNDGMRNTIQNVTNKMCKQCSVFTGIHSFIHGSYQSVEGIPLSLIPHQLEEHEPDNHTNENCIAIRNGKLAEVNCRQKFPFMCYRARDTINLNECSTTDNGYAFIKASGKCYKLHTMPKDWHNAQVTCTAEGGHLLVINSKAEAQIISKLMEEKGHSSNIKNNVHKEAFHVGFLDYSQHGDWYTVLGETLEEAGYAEWSVGQPDNYGGKQNCGSIFRSALLDDDNCSNIHAFICEKDPKKIVGC